MKELKFGGSSVASAERMKGVQKIVERQDKLVLIVVSALQGITDQLEKLAVQAFIKEAGYKDILQEIKTTHYR